jgi:tetratricopeptide (TPR) repeat protein
MDRLSRKDMLLNLLSSEPNDVFLNYALAMELEGLNHHEEAEKQFLKTLDVSTDYLPCFYRLGQIAEKIRGKEKALEYYRKGLELAKKLNDTRTVGEINQAIELLEED